MKKMFLDGLPRRHGKPQQIDWIKSIGYKVKGIYDELEFEVEIINYDVEKHHLYIKYKDKDIFGIYTDSFKKCRLGGFFKEEIFTYTYDQNNTRRTDLRNLPLNEHGIDWMQVSKNKIKIPFVYDDIKGEMEIVNYKIKEQKLYIKYSNKNIFKINTGNFTKCKLGKYLGKYTNDFKVETGTHFKDDKRNIIIIDRDCRERKDKINESQKWYKYKCNKCGYEDWIEESNLLHGTGCSVCCYSPRKSILGINTIWDTDRWMCDLGISEEDAKKYTHCGDKRIKTICPDCKMKKMSKISDIYSNHSIGCSCGDGISYPEKIMYSVLKQLNILFRIQLNKSTFNWCDKYKYDFYISSFNCIIETHGLQHYDETGRKGARTLQEEQENDKVKEQLAKENGIENYIVVDARKSDLEWIKNNILNSKLAKLCNMNNIDWKQCEEFALSNLVKKACELKRDNPDMTTVEIGKIMNIHRKTIIRYLKKGTKLEWCHYNAKEEMRKSNIRNGKLKGTPIKLFKDSIYLGEFKSIPELERQSEEKLGVKLLTSNIYLALSKSKMYKGYTFK